MNSKLFLGIIFLTAFFVQSSAHADSSILSPEENLWLKSRNNTIVFYPEKNHPPFSYQSPSGRTQGLFIDYIELISEKIGAKVEYLSPRSLSQIQDDMKAGKKDTVISISGTKEREEYLFFTEEYISVPAVIVVRKDSGIKNDRTLNDFSGKEVAVVDGYAVEGFIQKNFPRIVLERVSDDEVGLQQLVLGEVDAVVMDIVTLSHYLSKQVLNSVKIVGNTGFDYKYAFAVAKGDTIAQSVLEKGLSQISKSDRDILNDKWVTSPSEERSKSPFENGALPYFSGTLIALLGFAFVINRKYSKSRHSHLKLGVDELKEELAELAHANRALKRDMEEIKELEEDIEKKMEKID